MKHIVIDPVLRQASLFTSSLLARIDKTGKTIVDVADDFDWLDYDVDLENRRLVPTDAKRLALLRAERDRRLSETDWTQLMDVPAQTRAKWASYRQALRDLPAAVANVRAPVWPQRPE